MGLKVAVIHEWLVNYAGSERVLEQIIKVFPQADLFSQIDFLAEGERAFIGNKKAHTSFIQWLPGARTKYRAYLPLMPFAVGTFDVSGYDLIISNSHSVAKGVRKNQQQLQICYCHSPMRYAWDLQTQYLKESGLDRGIKGMLVKAVLDRIRAWDFRTAQQVNYFIANSHYIQARIKRAYKRDAAVIYPPVDVSGFQINDKKEGFFLTVSRMVPYKKIDIIVDAFSQSGMPLVVIGDGPDFEKTRLKAKKNIEFLGFQNDDMVKEYMGKARAFVFAAEEDFGIVPVEAQACGTPVIAFGKGGVTETVVPFPSSQHGGDNRVDGAPTGIFFHEQTPSALIEAVKRFETVEDTFNAHEIRKNAERFSTERFQKEFTTYTEERIRDFIP